jgi:hypothetical protein
MKNFLRIMTLFLTTATITSAYAHVNRMFRLNIVLSKAFDITDQEDVNISDKIAALNVILTTYDKISDVLLGQPIVKEVVDKFKIKRKQLEEAANEIQREREKDRERKRSSLTTEEYEAAKMETEDRNRLVA